MSRIDTVVKQKMSILEIARNVQPGHNRDMRNRIREFRNKKGLSVQQLADLIGVAQGSTISKLETGRQPVKLDHLESIAAALGVEPYELIYFGPEQPEKARRLPMIGMVSAGNWSEAIQHADEYFISADGGPRSFALKVTGQSMNRVIPEGKIIVVDPDDLDLIDGKIYVIMNGDGEACMKRFRASNGPARFEPDSTEEGHKTIKIGQDQYTVVGRVVFSGERW